MLGAKGAKENFYKAPKLIYTVRVWYSFVVQFPPPPPGALIRPSGEDAMGRSCILDSHPGRWMPAAVRMPAVVRMPACHSRRFKGERTGPGWGALLTWMLAGLGGRP